ncbi:MAG: AAA family ATPase [Pseudomonadota bacterium]
MTMPTLISFAADRYRNLHLSKGVALNPLNILIGPNGSGKTNAVRLLQFLKSCVVGSADDLASGTPLASSARILGGSHMLDRSLKYPGRVDLTYEFLPPPDLRHRWASLTHELGIYAYNSESPVGLCFEALSASQTKPDPQLFYYYKFHDQGIGKGVVSYFDTPDTRKSHFERMEGLPTGVLGLAVLPDILERFSHAPDMTPVYPVRRYLIDHIRGWRFYNANDMNFEEIRTSEPKIGPPDIYLSGSGNNLALVMDNLVQRHLEFDERLNIAMKSVLPRTRKVRAVRTGLMGLAVQWHFDDTDAPFYLTEMSDGTVRMLCWATVLLSPRLPTLLVIDEPELGIHPAWLPMLGEWIKDASRRTDVIVSTHSPDLLDHFTDSPESVICFSTRDGRYFSAGPLSSERLEGKLKEGWQLGDLWRVGDPDLESCPVTE